MTQSLSFISVYLKYIDFTSIHRENFENYFLIRSRVRIRIESTLTDVIIVDKIGSVEIVILIYYTCYVQPYVNHECEYRNG